MTWRDASMSQLTIYNANQPEIQTQVISNHSQIAACLNNVGVLFERWAAEHEIAQNDSEESHNQDSHNQDSILAAYDTSIANLKKAGGYTTADIVSLYPTHPDKDAFRAKFLSEHTHAEDEVRFFVKGSGLFCLHINKTIYAVLCEQGDLISVPAGVTHWFDMGSNPEFTCIRLFTNPDGWVAQFTGSDIATRVPNMDVHQEKNHG